MSELKPCPCGETPNELHVDVVAGTKWAYASGDCCDDWSVEFRTGYETNQTKLKALAAVAWNETPRAQEKA